MVKIGLIGYGYWGPKLVRNFFDDSACKVKTVVDLRRESLEVVKKYYPSIRTSTTIDEVFEDSKIDAVVISTPVSTHFSLGKKALNQGKHVLIEKPMTTSYREAIELVNLAKKKKKVLMVDHTFLYTDAVPNELGKISYFDSTRTNLGLFQKDVNVLWDLAAHDISILTYLVKEKPQSILASGISHTKNKLENIVFVTIKYPSGFIAHLNCSWSSPVKIRLILIGGKKKMIVYNDVEPTEKIKVYDSGYKIMNRKDPEKFQVDYRIGDIHIPKIELQEALIGVTRDFLHAIEFGSKPISNAALGLEVVKILSLADKSMRNGEWPMKYEKSHFNQ
ncbi:Gfo/Idh/MocA family oxidoreductase [Candidatus Roizmanbacteria bacterium]|nr:Gfo/Idh/MocA family oxidoreductase [Candidatus Roizmanbacteria bacterium]